jgi:hypothetical protein
MSAQEIAMRTKQVKNSQVTRLGDLEAAANNPAYDPFRTEVPGRKWVPYAVAAALFATLAALKAWASVHGIG